MVKVLEVNNLSFQDFHNLNLSFHNGKMYSIVGENKSGKTTLFNLIAGFIVTDNHIACANTLLNRMNRYNYIKRIGVVSKLNNNSFLYAKVIDEMNYPLHNLNYTKADARRRINEVLKIFHKEDIIDKKIKDLNYQDKQLLLIMISLLHQPKVLLLDGVLSVFSLKERNNLINILRYLIKSDNITVINFTSSLDETVYSDKIILLSHFKIIGEYKVSEYYQNDQLFYQNNLELPFIIDLNNKLKMYNLLNKDYLSMKEMVDDIWQ